jgi:hypothetical protein
VPDEPEDPFKPIVAPDGGSHTPLPSLSIDVKTKPVTSIPAGTAAVVPVLTCILFVESQV